MKAALLHSKCGRAPPLPGLEELWGAVFRGSLEMKQGENHRRERKVYYSRGWLFSELAQGIHEPVEVIRRFASQLETPSQLPPWIFSGAPSRCDGCELIRGASSSRSLARARFLAHVSKPRPLSGQRDEPSPPAFLARECPSYRALHLAQQAAGPPLHVPRRQPDAAVCYENARQSGYTGSDPRRRPAIAELHRRAHAPLPERAQDDDLRRWHLEANGAHLQS